MERGLGVRGFVQPLPPCCGCCSAWSLAPPGHWGWGPAETWEVQGASGELGSYLPAQTHQIPLAVESLTVSFLSQVSDELVMGLSKRGLQR